MKRETVAEHYGSFENYQRHELKRLLWYYRGHKALYAVQYAAAWDRQYKTTMKELTADCGRVIEHIKRGIEKSGSGYVDKIILALWEVHKDEEYGKRKVH